MSVTRLLQGSVRAAAVAGLGLALVDVPLQVADHVCLAGDGDRTHDAVVMSHMSARRLQQIHTRPLGFIAGMIVERVSIGRMHSARCVMSWMSIIRLSEPDPGSSPGLH